MPFALLFLFIYINEVVHFPHLKLFFKSYTLTFSVVDFVLTGFIGEKVLKLFEQS